MRLIRMEDGMPKRENFKLRPIFEEFLAMDIKVAKIDLDPGDYKSNSVACNVLRVAAKRHDFPVKVRMRNGEVYFERTDI